MTPWPARHLGAPALIGIVIGGCVAHTPPRLTLTHATVIERSPEAVVVAFAVAADNVNPHELPLREVHYTLRIAGQEAYRGVRVPGATLRRLGTQSFSVPAVIVLSPAQAPPVGPVDYTFSATVFYTTPGDLARLLYELHLRRPAVTFTHAGVLDLGHAP